MPTCLVPKTSPDLPSPLSTPPNTSAASFLSRTLTDPVLTGVPFIDQHGALRAGQLMEVCGVGGSGKTEILMQAAVNCALPVESHGVRFGGCATHVLLLDLDGKFDTLRLLKILTARITDALGRRGGAGNDESNGDETNSINQNNARISDAVYRESVGRFRMIRCQNSLDFLKALAVVGRVFERHETNAGGGYGEIVGGMTDGGANGNGNNSETFSKKKTNDKPPRRLLLVDNVAAFYWLDRASRREHGAPLSLHTVHHLSAEMLLEISRRCKAPVICTKAVVVSSAQQQGNGHQSNGANNGPNNQHQQLKPPQQHKDFLPPKWTSAVTQRLVLDVEREGQGHHGNHNGNLTDSRIPQAGDRSGRGGVPASFVAWWELPSGRPNARYVVDGEAGIRVCE